MHHIIIGLELGTSIHDRYASLLLSEEPSSDRSPLDRTSIVPVVGWTLSGFAPLALFDEPWWCPLSLDVISFAVRPSRSSSTMTSGRSSTPGASRARPRKRLGARHSKTTGFRVLHACRMDDANVQGSYDRHYDHKLQGRTVHGGAVTKKRWAVTKKRCATHVGSSGSSSSPPPPSHRARCSPSGSS